VIRLILLLFLCHSTALATLTISNESKTDDFSILYFYDATQKLDIDDIETQSFTQTIPNQFALGYKTGTAWFKITFDNQSSHDNFVLYFTEPFWSSFDLFLKHRGSWEKVSNGLNTPISQRPLHDSNPAFLLNLKQNTQETIYIRGTTISSFIGEFQLFTQEAYFRPTRISIPDFYIFYSAILLFMMLLVGFLFSIVKERLYFFYIGYVLSFIVWISTVSGTYLSLGFTPWKEGLHATGALVILFLILFSSEFLNLRIRSPRTHIAFLTFGVAATFFFFAITFNLPYINLIFNIYASVFFTLLTLSSYRAWRGNYSYCARYYLIALMIYMPTMGIMTLTYNGLLPNNDITRYSYILGSFIEILFFSFVLASRYLKATNLKLQFQNELIEEKQKNKRYLEYEIKKRTHELLAINQELEHTKEELAKKADTDALSQLFNRRYFSEISQSMFAQSKTNHLDLSLLMIDIDKFKEVNDTYGHIIGDKAIIYCANVFKTLARQSDIVTRYGGEEFVILLPRTKLGEAMILAERIRHNIHNKVICETQTNLKLTISIGVSQINLKEDENIEALIKRADKALYQAKAHGRNRVESL